MAKKKPPTKKRTNRTDLTLRNLRALKARINSLELRIVALEQVAALQAQSGEPEPLPAA